MRCLDKDRARRYETASGLARDVERYLADEPVDACPPSTSYRLGKFARKYKKALATASAFAGLMVAAVVMSTMRSKTKGLTQWTSPSSPWRTYNSTKPRKQMPSSSSYANGWRIRALRGSPGLLSSCAKRKNRWQSPGRPAASKEAWAARRRVQAGRGGINQRASSEGVVGNSDIHLDKDDPDTCRNGNRKQREQAHPKLPNLVG
jgi:hypothetical protein